MRANRREPVSVLFWFQSIRSPAWRVYALGCSYSFARKHKVAGMARSYSQERWKDWACSSASR